MAVQADLPELTHMSADYAENVWHDDCITEIDILHHRVLPAPEMELGVLVGSEVLMSTSTCPKKVTSDPADD